MPSVDAPTMTADDTRLAEILALLNSIDERLPKRRVKSVPNVGVPPAVETLAITAPPAEKPKRARKPSAKATAAAASLLAGEPSDIDEQAAPPVKAVRKPRAAKKVADTDASALE